MFNFNTDAAVCWPQVSDLLYLSNFEISLHMAQSQVSIRGIRYATESEFPCLFAA